MAIQTAKLTYLRGVKKRPKVGSQQLAVVKRPRVAVAPIVKQTLAFGAGFYLGRATAKRPGVKAPPTTVRVPMPVPMFVDRPVPIFVDRTVFVDRPVPAAKTRERPTGKRPGKRPPTAKVTLAQFASFAEGQVIQDIPVTSSWVVSVQLVKFHGEPTLAITFKGSSRTGPVTCLYPGTALKDFDSILRSPSKGKWVWANVYYEPYVLFGG